MLNIGDNNPTYSYLLGAHYLSVIDSFDDLGLLCEAASLNKYDVHMKRTLRTAYGAMFLILRGISSRRADVMCTVLLHLYDLLLIMLLYCGFQMYFIRSYALNVCSVYS